jgi:hypothetical protein
MRQNQGGIRFKSDRVTAHNQPWFLWVIGVVCSPQSGNGRRFKMSNGAVKPGEIPDG